MNARQFSGALHPVRRSLPEMYSSKQTTITFFPFSLSTSMMVSRTSRTVACVGTTTTDDPYRAACLMARIYSRKDLPVCLGITIAFIFAPFCIGAPSPRSGGRHGAFAAGVMRRLSYDEDWHGKKVTIFRLRGQSPPHYRCAIPVYNGIPLCCSAVCQGSLIMGLALLAGIEPTTHGLTVRRSAN